MEKLDFTKEELLSIMSLVIENRDSAKLQKISQLSYMDSINLRSKIEGLINKIEKNEWEEKQKNIYEISYEDDMMVILDKLNNKDYKIDINLVHDGEIAEYIIEDRVEKINDIEKWLSESKSASDKELMREDLETLRQSKEKYVFSYYGTNGFVCKDLDVEEFNKICLEVIESYNLSIEEAKGLVEDHQKEIKTDKDLKL